MDSLYIVMPAYNEEKCIEKVVKQWYPLLEGKGDNSRLVVADSGSTDRTHEILRKICGGGYDKLEILEHTNKEHGAKVIALYDYAIKNDIDYIFQTDSDGQTNPDEFSSFWEMRKNYEGIFGNRTKRGDGKRRKIVEKVVCWLIKIYFGVKVPDANAPFRLMRTDSVRKYLYKLPVNYKLPNIMMVVYFACNNERISFPSISFDARKEGRNSINIRKIITIGFESLRDFWILRKTCVNQDEEYRDKEINTSESDINKKTET